jgi:uncharacterized protein YjbI with pentapeptide repeats
MYRLRRIVKRTRVFRAARWLLRRLPVILMLSVLVIAAIHLLNLLYALPGSGFGSSVNWLGQAVPARTLWDWLELLAAPLVLTAGALLITLVILRGIRKNTQAQQYYAQIQATTQMQEENLQAYLTRLNDLLLTGQLDNPETREKARLVARTWLTLHLSTLNLEQRARVMRFLYEVGLLKGALALKLSALDFSQTTLGGANLAGAELTDAYLPGARLEHANLNRTNLTRANLTHTRLEQAMLVNAQLEKAQMIGTRLLSANLRGANLESANLSWAVLQRTHLQGARLANALLERAHLEWAHLEDANLDGAYLKGAQLQKANLSNAKLTWAHLQHAQLDGVNLKGADLKYANLQGANLRNAKVTPEQLAEAVLDRKTILPDGSRYQPPARARSGKMPQSVAL